MKLHARNPTDQIYLPAVLNYDSAVAEKSVGIDEALVSFIHDLAIPAVRAGTAFPLSNGTTFTYPVDSVLTHGENLFAGAIRLEADTDNEPVVVTLLMDGAVTDFSGSVPRTADQAIVRVYVSAVWEKLALDSAWRLHGLFSKKPAFHRQLTLNQGDASERSVVDLRVRAVWPLDDPAISDRDGNRVGATFRLSTRHQRE